MQKYHLRSVVQTLRFDGLFWRKLMYIGCAYGPEWWKRYSPPAWAALFFLLVATNRRGSVINMARILGNPGGARALRTAFSMWVQFAYCMTETMEYYGPYPKPLRLDVPERDELSQALAEGRGVIIVTGHFGNWDIAAKALRNYGRPIRIVMAREINATTHEYVRLAREQAGVNIIYSDNSVFSSLNMLRALRQNEIIAIQLDRPLLVAATSLVPFFGALAPFSSGPFVLARLSRAPVVPIFIPRLGNRHYAIRTFGRITLPAESRSTATLQQAMAAAVRSYEEIIREFPTQWFQFAPYWPEQSIIRRTVADREQERLRATS